MGEFIFGFQSLGRRAVLPVPADRIAGIAFASWGCASLPLKRWPMTIIYKISPKQAWRDAQSAGVFSGAAIDVADGYIHFSAAHQVRETATKHFRGQSDLILAGIDAKALGDALKWELSRGGDLFPHLYGPLPMHAVVSLVDLPLDQDGVPVVPELSP